MEIYNESIMDLVKTIVENEKINKIKLFRFFKSFIIFKKKIFNFEIKILNTFIYI
jgi:hypothetical protein